MNDMDRKNMDRYELQINALVDGELDEAEAAALKARVRISMGARTGKLSVEFSSIDDLERVVGVIAAGLQQDIALDPR